MFRCVLNSWFFFYVREVKKSSARSRDVASEDGNKGNSQTCSEPQPTDHRLLFHDGQPLYPGKKDSASEHEEYLNT